MKPRWLRLAAGGAGCAMLATAAIGWMHTSSGLRFLAAAGVPCPVNKVEAAQIDRLRAPALASLRAVAPAPARPVPLGMVLDRTTQAEAAHLLAQAHAQCEQEVRGYHYLRCRGVDAAALALAGPPVSEMWLSFNTAGLLVGVDIYRRGMAAAELRAAWRADADGLRAALGTPSLVLGDPDPQALAASPVQVARLQYRYTDYVATVTASHLPHAGLSVREQFMSSRL